MNSHLPIQAYKPIPEQVFDDKATRYSCAELFIFILESFGPDFMWVLDQALLYDFPDHPPTACHWKSETAREIRYHKRRAQGLEVPLEEISADAGFLNMPPAGARACVAMLRWRWCGLRHKDGAYHFGDCTESRAIN